MKKITIIIFSMLFFLGFAITSCTSNEDQAKTEKQILDEMNKSMQEKSTDMIIDTSSKDSTLLK